MNGQPYQTSTEARADIFDSIERCHNPRRRRRLELQQQGERLLTQPSEKLGENPTRFNPNIGLKSLWGTDQGGQPPFVLAGANIGPGPVLDFRASLSNPSSTVSPGAYFRYHQQALLRKKPANPSITVTAVKGVTCPVMGNSDEARSGDEVFTLGFPRTVGYDTKCRPGDHQQFCWNGQ